MAKEIYYFLEQEEIVQLVKMVSQEIEILFYKTGRFENMKEVSEVDLCNYEPLGLNSHGNHQSESYLVMKKNLDLNIRKINQTSGKDAYFVDQQNNKDSVIFWPGGRYDSRHLICGHVGTISNTIISSEIMKVFIKNVKKLCKHKVGKYYVSNNVQLLKDTRLITININQSTEYDLKMQ